MANRTSQDRVWPYLVILVLLFFFVLSVPRHWERAGRNRTLDQMLAARPPAPVVESVVKQQPEPSEVVEVVEVVEEPVAEPVVVEPARPVSELFALPSHLVEVQNQLAEPLADPPLPPAADDPYANPPPLDGWPRPHALLLLIERLAKEPAYKNWAEETSKSIRELTTERRPSADRTQELIDEINDAIPPIQALIEETEYHHPQSQLRRARYGLSRRIDLWRLAHEATRESYDRLASRAPLEDIVLTPKLIPTPVSDAISEVRAFTEQRENGETWDQFLRLSDLDELASDADNAELRAKRHQLARQVLRRMASVSYSKKYIPVSTNPAIGQLRESLRHWASETVDARELLEHVEQYELYGLPSDARQIALHYQRLAWAPEERDKQLGNQLGRHYRNANVRMAISDKFLNRLLPEPSTITEPIDDFIGGVPSYGTSDTHTKLKLRLVRDARRLHMNLDAIGVVESESESDAGFATLFSRGHTRFAARKAIAIDREKIHLLPAGAWADSSNELVDIMTRLESVPLFGSLADNIVRNQRDRRYDEVVSEVEQMVADKARRRLDEEVIQRTADAEKKLKERVVEPLKKFGLDPTTISLATTDDRVIFRHRLAGYEQLGAHTPRPRAPSDSLISCQVHQSVLNNGLENLQLAGKTFTVPELHAWINKRIDREPGESADKLAEDSEGIELTFPARDVLRVTCDDNRVTTTLVFRRLTKGRRSWTNFGVRTYFEPQVDGLNVKFVRQGSFEIVSRKYGKKPQFLLRSIVARMLGNMKEFDAMPAKVSTNERLADLAITQLDFTDGWIALALGPARNGHFIARRESAKKE